MSTAPPERQSTPLSEKIKTMLTETRVVLPGVQALLGFQFTAILTDSFDRLPPGQRTVHLVSLFLVAVAVLLLMAPAAYHRIVAQGEDLPDVEKFATRATLGAMAPLALGLCAEFYVVLQKAVHSTTLALAAASLGFLAFLGLWLVYPLSLRVLRGRTQRRSSS